MNPPTWIPERPWTRIACLDYESQRKVGVTGGEDHQPEVVLDLLVCPLKPSELYITTTFGFPWPRKHPSHTSGYIIFFPRPVDARDLQSNAMCLSSAKAVIKPSDYRNRNVKYIVRVYICLGMEVIVSEIIPDIVSVTVMKTPPGLSVAMLEGRGLELEVAEDTMSDGGTISGGETSSDGETTSDVVFWVGHDEDPPSRLTGQ